ncbi:hypothetical protein [Burkholderia sp. MSMB1835]|uniref:hypothetical protein n=1 Tax=Burkholderia sp. MSMB1835 TaxID=1637876 RepID=UPI00211D4DC2|nr:hypothetical protein [Burkholderia sp. MSMB1835]
MSPAVRADAADGARHAPRIACRTPHRAAEGIAAGASESSAEASDQVRRVRTIGARFRANGKQERSATPNLGAERRIGSHPHSRGGAIRIAGSVTVGRISGRWIPAIRVPIASFAPNRFIVGPPPATRIGEPPSASRVSHLRVAERTRALRINP